jgi:GT2 family glycosyltransferase
MSAPLPIDTATVDVIVVTHQSADWIVDCLSSVPDVVGRRRVRLSVVDSASDDDTVDRALDQGRVDLIARVDNRGFASAVNRGMALTDGEYVLLLNPDATLGVDALTRLVERLDREPDLAAAAPALVDGRGRTQPVAQAQPSLRGELARTFQWIGRRLGLRRPDELAADEAPGWLSGACLCLRREAWRRVGPFDAGYFLYFEETDWCRRALARGYRLALVEDALAVHAGGASSAGDARRSELARRLFVRSRRRFFTRHHGLLRAAAVEVLHGLRARLDRLRGRAAR